VWVKRERANRSIIPRCQAWPHSLPSPSPLHRLILPTVPSPAHTPTSFTRSLVMTWAERRRWTSSVLLRPEQNQAITTEARRRKRKRRKMMEEEARWRCLRLWRRKASEESDRPRTIHGVGSPV